ncbi:MAG: hypothetical protein SVO01_00295 [Thermotogota bacterium]|nr:hypothetical protein [Thermotogota bacterium]
MSNGEEPIEKWENIAKLFGPLSANTARRKYLGTMLREGFVFASYVGNTKRRLLWTYPSLVKAFISMVQAKNGKV